VMRTWLEVAERLVNAIERLAATQEQRQPAPRPRVARRGLRAPKNRPGPTRSCRPSWTVLGHLRS